MRRLILEEPWSQAAIWSRRLAFFALALGGIAVILTRTQTSDPTPGLAVLGASLLAACLAVLVAAAGLAVIWRSGRRGAGIALAGAALGLAVLAFPAYLAMQALRLPVLNDVATDLVNPPAFSRSSRALAARGGFVHPDIPEAWRSDQRRAYPDVQPFLLDLEPDDAWQLVLKAVAARGWRVVEQVAPGGRIGFGHIDAIDRTLVLGLQDDITIRVRPLAGQTRIDVRSASRVGRHDFGDNARRIIRFSQELQAQLDDR